MGNCQLPDEDVIRAYVEEDLPAGVELVGIRTTYGRLAPGMPEQFNVEITLREDEEAHPFGAPGLGYALCQRVRRRWPPESFCLSVRTVTRTNEEGTIGRPAGI